MFTGFLHSSGSAAAAASVSSQSLTDLLTHPLLTMYPVLVVLRLEAARAWVLNYYFIIMITSIVSSVFYYVIYIV